MNGRSQQQFSTKRRGYNLLEGGRNERSQTGPVLEAFSFGPFRTVPYARLLERSGTPIPLSSRAFDLLCLFVSRPGEIVSKGELMAKTWPDVTVEESSLRFHIIQLRRALGDSQGSERYVVNVPGRGYCFVACVRRETIPLKQSHGNGTTGSTLHVHAARRLATI